MILSAVEVEGKLFCTCWSVTSSSSSYAVTMSLTTPQFSCESNKGRTSNSFKELIIIFCGKTCFTCLSLSSALLMTCLLCSSRIFAQWLSTCTKKNWVKKYNFVLWGAQSLKAVHKRGSLGLGPPSLIRPSAGCPKELFALERACTDETPRWVLEKLVTPERLTA